MRRRRSHATDSTVQRFSEPFPPHGALAAEGAENLLGRPRLDPLVVLVREAVQNSWDARRESVATVEFAVHGHRLDGAEHRQLRESVFPHPPKAAERLRDVLGRDDLFLLALTDRGTTGLGGPIRADRPPGRGEPSNFVDLLFNIGQPAPRDLGGGTYGFGRTISFVVSEARAVIVYSRTKAGRRYESRFISAAYSDHYTERGHRYTGRHWWGRTAQGSVEPVVGAEADRLAASVGLATFGPDESGTTIAVVAPDLRGREPIQAMRFLAGALTWNFWPKMLTRGGQAPAMRFAVSLDGDDVPVPQPEDTPPLHAFVASLRAVWSAEDDTMGPSPVPIVQDDLETHLREVILPKTGERIGWLALTRGQVRTRPQVDEGADEEAERGTSAAFEGPAHHVALLRHPELVVEHLSTAELPTPSAEYAGVFKPVRQIDRAFARAEPPTHDAWNPNLVPETKLRRFVGVALRMVREETAAFADEPGGAEPDAARRLARTLDVLFATPDRDTDRSASMPVVLVDDVRLVDGDGPPVREVSFSVRHLPQSAGTVVEARARVATHDGWTVEQADDRRVEVIGFVREDGTARQMGPRATLAAGDDRRWVVQVRSPAGVSVGLDLVAEPAGAREP